MDCREARSLIDLYLDGELPLERALEMEAHLARCPSRPGCGALAEERRKIARAVRGSLDYEPAAERLRQGIASRIMAEPGDEDMAQNGRAQDGRATLGRAASLPAGPTQTRRRLPEWLRLAAAIVLSAGLGGALVGYQLPTASDFVQEDVVASHLRALLSGSRLIDVASSDEHTVKPWFNRRIDYAPPVYDLTAEGYPLVGGRADYVNGRTVAALVYRHSQHLVTLFVWPSESGEQPVQTASDHGEHIVRWASREMAYWAVSDLDPTELADFGRLISTHGGSPR